MVIDIGDKVKFVNEELEGIVSQLVEANRIIVTCIDGFDYEVSINDVVVVRADNTHVYTIDEQEISKKINPIKKGGKGYKSSKSILTPYIKKTKFNYEKMIEVDLHLEELVEFPQKLDDWQKLHTQLQHVKKCLEAALDENINKIIFIHGVGTGVLKIELRNYLANFSNLIINDADFREYGKGATEILIKNNSFNRNY